MKLDLSPALDRPDLLAGPVVAFLRSWPEHAGTVQVAPIDADVADTAAFCAAYDVGLDESANCVVIAGRREGEVRYAACLVLATTRADVNGTVRRYLNARKASFASMDDAVAATGMEYGGITPIGLPKEWPILIDSRVVAMPQAVVGSGVRRSKIVLSGAALADLPGAEVIENLAKPA